MDRSVGRRRKENISSVWNLYNSTVGNRHRSFWARQFFFAFWPYLASLSVGWEDGQPRGMCVECHGLF